MKNQNHTPTFPTALRLFGLLACLALLPFSLRAEGIQQIAPTAADAPIMLETGRPSFGSFADFNGPSSSRLYVSINSADEVLYLGLAPEYTFEGLPYNNSFSSRYRFRIRRDDGLGNSNPVVHGPFEVTDGNANVNSWADAAFGNYDVTATTNGGDEIFAFRPDAPGEYYIEFDESFITDDDFRVYVPFWDFTVTDVAGTPINGRVWSRNWAFRTPRISGQTDGECVWDRPFNGTIYSYTSDGFVSKIDFADSGMQGLSFNLAFNSTGPGTSGILTEDRMSIPGINATANASEHQIFLNEPDINLFPDGICGEITPSNTFQCTGDNMYCLDITVTKPGQVEVILDFNRNGMLDDSSQDVSFIYEFNDSTMLSACVPWNGLRGDSTMAGAGDTINLILVYSQGVQHWSAYDVEFIKDGYCIETIRPVCPDTDDAATNLYWDDRSIPEDPGTGATKDGRDGCPCETGCRTWDYFDINAPDCNSWSDNNTLGYGDKSTLNTWWFANSRIVVTVDIPLIDIDILGPDSICAGEDATWTASSNNSAGDATYLWVGPGVDSLTTESIQVSEAGEYCLTVEDSLNCSGTICKTLTVIDTPADVLTYPELITACPGELISIIPEGSTSNTTVSWSPGTGLSDSTSVSPILTVDGVVTYIVTIEYGALGCTIMDTVMVDPFEAPIAGFESDSDCNSVDIDFMSTSTNADSVFWDFGDLTTTNDTSSLLNPNYVYPAVGMYTVTLIAFSDDGCSDTISTTINVIDENPIDLEVDVNGTLVGPNNGTIGTVGNPVIICEPIATLTPVPAAGVTYIYLDANGDEIGSGPSYDHTMSGLTVITVLATDANDCTARLDVAVAGGPVDIMVPDTTIGCLGDPVMLEVINNDPNDTLTYVWAPADIFDDPTSGSPTITGEPGEYEVTVTATNQYDCEGMATAIVVAIDETDTLGFTAAVDCDGETVVFTNTSTAGFGYSWDFGDGEGSMEANPTHIYDMPGTYTVTLDLEYEQDCIEPFSMEIVVPELQLDADADLELGECANGMAMINFMDNTINNTGTPLTYAWTFNPGVPSTSDEADPSITVSESGTVMASLTVTSENGCVSTFDTTFTVSIPEINPPDTLIICPGDTAFLNPNPDESLTYTWTGDGGFMSSDPNPGTTEAGTYVVMTETNASDLNCSDSDTVVVVNGIVPDPVISGPDGDVVDNNDGTITIVNPGIVLDEGRGFIPEDSITLPYLLTCGETITLTAEDTDPNTTFTYTIYPDGSEVITDNPANFDLNPCDTLTILVTSTSEDGCLAYDTLALISAEIIATPEPAEIMSCAGQDTTLTVNVSGKITDVTYEWTGGPINGPADGSTIEITTPDDGMVDYQVVTTNAEGCTDTAIVTVTVVPFTPNNYDDVIAACFEEPTVITGEPIIDGYTYEWDPLDNLDLSDPNNPTVTLSEDATYTVTITDPSTGCSIVDTVMIVVAPEIGLVTSPADTVLCMAGTITLTATTMVGSDVTWYSDPDLTMEIGTGTTLDYEVPGAGTYTVYAEAIDPETGCSETSSSTIVVDPIEDGLPPTSISVCANDASTQTLFPGGMNSDYIYTYSPPELVDADGNFIGTEDAMVEVTVTDPATGCMVTQTVDVTYTDLSGLDIGAEPTTVILPGGTTTVTVTGCTDCTYDWSTDNGTINQTDGPTVIGTPTTAGTATYTVVVSSNGCSETLTTTIQVEEPICSTDRVYLPNAFTPNNDGQNDELRVRSNFIQEIGGFELMIFNRWGQEVYRSFDPLEAWDGTSEGDDLEPDVYGYWLTYVCPGTEERITQQGNVTILR